MKTILLPTLALALSLLVASPVSAHDDDKRGAVVVTGGGGGGNRNVVAVRGGGGNGGGAAHVYTGHTSGGYSGGYRGGYSGQVYRNSPSVSYGNSSHYSNDGNNWHGGNNHSTYAFGHHSGWNTGRSYFWHGHHYRWYNNGWFIIDPYPYYGYYGGGADDYDYSNAPDETYAAPAAPDEDANTGPVSVQVQRALARQGYYRGPIDGLIGPGTRSAITAYQRDNGLRPTGTINNHLLDALDLD